MVHYDKQTNVTRHFMREVCIFIKNFFGEIRLTSGYLHLHLFLKQKILILLLTVQAHHEDVFFLFQCFQKDGLIYLLRVLLSLLTIQLKTQLSSEGLLHFETLPKFQRQEMNRISYAFRDQYAGHQKLKDFFRKYEK